MAQFRATIQGNRGEASRLGTKDSGMIATVNGWGQGVQVEVRWDEEKQCDIHTIWRTSGSSRAKKYALVGRIINGEWFPEDDKK